jgi:hypothetical protein
VTEAQFTRDVLALARKHGVLAHHCRDSRHCEGNPGFLDLVLVGRKVLFAELKLEDGDTSADQDLWIWHLERATANWVLLRPADLESGAIEQILEAIR